MAGVLGFGNALGSSERYHKIFGRYWCLLTGLAVLWKMWGVHIMLDWNKDSLSNSNIWTSKLRLARLLWQEVSNTHLKENQNIRQLFAFLKSVFHQGPSLKSPAKSVAKSGRMSFSRVSKLHTQHCPSLLAHSEIHFTILQHFLPLLVRALNLNFGGTNSGCSSSISQHLLR